MIHVLRLLHILSGAFWYGAVIFTGRFMMPALGAVGPAAGPFMGELVRRKMPQAMMGAAIINVLAGIGMIYVVSGGNVGAWMQLNSSKTFMTGGSLAIIGFVIGMVMNAPAGKRLGEIMAGAAKRGGPPTPEEAAEVGRLQARIHTGTLLLSIFLTLAVAAMAVARYM
jgi:hypothetical protein